MAQALVELVGKFVARPSDALAERITALDHEPVDDAVKNDAVVVGLRDLLVRARVGPLLRPLGKPDKVGHRVGCLLVEEADREVSLSCFELCVDGQCAAPGWWLVVSGWWLVVSG